ncbi:MAG TPA: DNA-processing protein DprA [Streptosporangiaceae bacterium]|jgi:DNA processing protein
MTSAFDAQHVARARLTYLAEPGDPVLASWLEVSSPAEIVAAISAGQLPELPGIQTWTADGVVRRTRDLQAEKLEHAFRLWRQRLGDLPDELDLARFRRQGIRLVGPGDSEWPTQLDMLGVARPYALWLRGEADLRYCCLQSVSIVGARAASAYGTHVGTEMAAALAARGRTIVSGAAYGIDACAHQGALAADGVTIAVLACGVDHAYPVGHYDLLASIAAQGVLVSEWPPGRTPNRLRFLIRNRVIAALTRGTVVVEAGLRSGALNTARHARDLHRPVMAVPGPVTSEVSAGCHKIIREWGAVCVTGAHDVLELLTPLGETSAYDPPPDDAFCPSTGSDSPANHNGQLSLIGSPAGGRPFPPGPTLLTADPAVRTAPPRPGRGSLLAPDDLGTTSRAVLDAIPARGAGPAVIAVRAGRNIDAVVSSLGLLAAGGFVERCSHGWRLRRSP